MARTGKAGLRSHLKSLPAGECRELVLELWDRFPAVKDYFASRFSPEGSQAVLAKTKTQIARQLSTSTLNPRGDPAVARRVIAEFRRSQVRPEATIELLLFYVDRALEFVRTYGDERPVNSIARTFSDALRLAGSEDLISKFQPEIARLVEYGEPMGWGVGEHLRDEWLQYEPSDGDIEGHKRG